MKKMEEFEGRSKWWERMREVVEMGIGKVESGNKIFRR